MVVLSNYQGFVDLFINTIKRSSMNQKPFYSFSTLTETGLDLVPTNSLVQIEHPTEPKYIILDDKTNITNTTTIGDFLVNFQPNYTNIFSGHLHEYDSVSHTLKILTILPEITDFKASDNNQGFITVQFTQNGATQYDLYNDNSLIYENIPFNTLLDNNIEFTFSSSGTYPFLKIKSTFRDQTVYSNIDSGTALDDPSPITDFSASDNLLNNVSFSFTPSTGYPVPVHKLYYGNYPNGTLLYTYADTSDTYVDNFIGTRDYYITAANNTGGIHSNYDSGTGLEYPGVVNDFSASDNLENLVKMNWTDTSGWPTPTYDLWVQGDTSPLQYNISQGYVDSFTGTRTYYIQAVNTVSPTPSGVNSNYDSGTGLDELVLNLPQPSNNSVINLSNFINDNNPQNISTVKVVNNYTQPKIVTGDLGLLDVTIINTGEIQGNQSGSNGLEISNDITLINNGWIRGAGGQGGKGGKGGEGGKGGFGGQGADITGNNPSTGGQGGAGGNGGQGSAGGNGGDGTYYNHLLNNGLTGISGFPGDIGSEGSPSNPPGGNSGGRGGDGGDGGAGGQGGDWGQTGLIGSPGYSGNEGLPGEPGYGGGKPGEPGFPGTTGSTGEAGQQPGYAILGQQHIKPGSTLGNLSGDII